MKTVRKARRKLLFVEILVASLLVAGCAKEEAPPSYSIGTGGVQGSYLVVGSALASIVNDNRQANGFQLEHDMSSGSVANINAIIAGDNQFGIVQADDQYLAVNGLGKWKDSGPQKDLRAVFSMFTEAVTLVAGADTGIRSVEDLRGKLVDIGSPEAGTRRNAIDVLRAAGIDWEADILARGGSVDERLARFTRGELDAYFATIGHPNMETKFATLAARGVRLIPLTGIDGLVAENPYYSRTSISAELYPLADIDAGVDTIGVNATLLTTAQVPDDVVYAVTRAVFENVDALAGFDVEFNALLSDEYLDGLTAPVHPGAMRYYREAGLVERPEGP